MWIPLQGYLQYVKGLPLNDSPELFGLHDNADITFAQNETFALLGAIAQLQPKTITLGGHSREEVGAPVLTVLWQPVPSVGNDHRHQLSVVPPCLLGASNGTAMPALVLLLLSSHGAGLEGCCHLLLSLQIVEETSKDILAKLPDPMNVQEVILKYPLLYEESMNTVLVQEVIR